MPPVMLPAGIQHIGPPALPQFSPLGVGMGMGMGAAFAMGIPEANFSANCHMVPVPSIHGAQFPCPSVPGPSNLHGMQAPNLHMFGVSGQHLPFVHPHPPFFPFPGGFWSKEPSVPNVSGAATPVSNVDSSLPSGSKGQTENINLQTMHNTDTNCSQIRTSTEVYLRHLVWSIIVFVMDIVIHVLKAAMQGILMHCFRYVRTFFSDLYHLI